MQARIGDMGDFAIVDGLAVREGVPVEKRQIWGVQLVVQIQGRPAVLHENGSLYRRGGLVVFRCMHVGFVSSLLSLASAGYQAGSFIA